MYKILYSKQAIKTLRKLPNSLLNKIRKRILELAAAPYSTQHTKALKGIEAWRLRIGDWRVIYTIDN